MGGKRLIHLAGYTPPQGGSFIPFMRSVLKGAKARGWEVEGVFPQRARGRDWLAGFEQAEIPVRFGLESRRESTRWIEEMLEESAEPTILHTHFTVYDVAAALATRRRSNAHVYWHVHTVLSSSPRTVVANAIKFGLLGRSVERILCPAANIADGIRRRLGEESKISVFPSPIDVGSFQQLTEQQREHYRRSLGVEDGSHGLLLFGRDWEIKGGDVFLGAVSKLVAEGRPVLGLINQGGEQAAAAAAKAGLSEEVKVVGLDPNVQAMYGAAEVLVAPSRGEGMPFTVAESLCSGTPVVASDLPGHTYLGDELDACTITDRDPAQIAAAVARFLDMDREQVARECQRARTWIEERLGLQASVDRLVDDYEASLGAGSRGGADGGADRS